MHANLRTTDVVLNIALKESDRSSGVILEDSITKLFNMQSFFDNITRNTIPNYKEYILGSI